MTARLTAPRKPASPVRTVPAQKTVTPPKVGKVAAKVSVPTVVSSVETKVIKGVPLGPDGKTALVDLVLPKDVLSVTLYVKGTPGVDYLVNQFNAGGDVLTSAAPKGIPISASIRADNPIDAGQLRSPNRSALGAFSGSAQYMAPNNPSITLKPGKAQFSVQGFAAGAQPGSSVAAKGTVDVVVQIKRISTPEPKRGQLPIHLYFSGANGYTAATAKKSPLIQAAIEEVKASYGAAGIDISEVTFQDVPTKFQRPESPKDTERLFSKGTHQDGVGLFFVGQLPTGGTSMGASAGMPGPTATSGIQSGVLVCTRDTPIDFGVPASGADFLAKIMQHELGHYLGLFHTADSFLRVDDQLSDTKTNDPSNIMFPEDTSTPMFSKQQAKVLLRHPAVVNVQ